MTVTGLIDARGCAKVRAMKKAMMLSAAMAGMVAGGGCVTVNAPDKPIVINLNISISQEVVYRLDGEAKSLIQSNPGIF
ncbi:YnbE family lipoprotein [Sphingomonas sp. RS2018]